MAPGGRLGEDPGGSAVHLLEEALHVERGPREDHQLPVVGLSDGPLVAEENGWRDRDGVVKVLVETNTLGAVRVKRSSRAGSSDGAGELELSNVLTSVSDNNSGLHLRPRLDLRVVNEGHNVLPQLQGTRSSSTILAAHQILRAGSGRPAVQMLVSHFPQVPFYLTA